MLSPFLFLQTKNCLTTKNTKNEFISYWLFFVFFVFFVVIRLLFLSSLILLVESSFRRVARTD
jgi:hypothetical protein